MDSKASSLLFLAILCVFSSTTTAFNITRILANYPYFSTFNNLLSQTGLAQEINTRQTITVLAVANSNIGGVSGKPVDIMKRILSAHVILDYYDQAKLSKLQKKSSILTTLYQTTGIADDQQGFLNVTKTPNGIMFGSAAKGAPLTASLESLITSQPYNISVLKVSGVIEAPGIENMAPPPPPTPGAPPKKAPAPAPSAESPAASPAPAAEEPAADETPTEAPAEATSDAPADAPASYAPISDAPADGPDADSQPADAPPPSSASDLHTSAAAMLVGLVAAIMRF